MLKERSVAFPLLPSSSVPNHPDNTAGLPPFLDFFAGSGLVTEGLGPYFHNVWANDIDEKKAAVFCANHPLEIFHLGPIENVAGARVPPAILSWASFPCQDLSLAGNMEGIESARSGLVWHWLRVMDEMVSRPPIIVAENVLGLVSADGGKHYRRLHNALVDRNYRVGAIELDAVHWVPQSRSRIFVIGVDKRIPASVLELSGPSWCHPNAVQKAVGGLRDWVWWGVPRPAARQDSLEQLVDFEASCDDPIWSKHNLDLLSTTHRERLKLAAAEGQRVFPGYKRTRKGRQALELRFDGVAGCLRTPQGGSSRQLLVLMKGGRYQTRLLTVRETARLMGAREDYRIPGSYNDGYHAMGDAVAVPVARYLGQHLLAPIAQQAAVLEVL